MNEERELDGLIARMARGEAVDWDAARTRITTVGARARLEALQGIDRIAAFNHAQWEAFAPLVDEAPDLDAVEPPPAPVVAEANLAGQVVGAYTLDELLGTGGMGAVWLAHRSDGRFEGQAAVKLLHLPRVRPEGLARFRREGQLLARMHHANIAHLLDAGALPNGQPFLVLEYVDGEPIDGYCDRLGLGVRARIELFLAVLEAVAHAQANLVLHRDLKPSNILVDRTGTVKLLDFGVGKLLADEETGAAVAELTRDIGGALTPEYAAPEQLLGTPATTATDVFAAGAVLYLLLTGRHPTGDPGTAPVQRMRAILETAPRPASEAAVAEPSRTDPRRRRDLKGDLDNILARALRKDPRDRYPNAAAFADDLRRYLNREPVAARPDTLAYRVGRFVARHRIPVASAVAAAVVLAGLTAFSLVELVEVRRQRDEVRAQMQRAEGFNTVVTSLLSQKGENGRALTPEELLDRAVDEVRATYADDPAFLVDMLIRISGRYFDLADHRKELDTLVLAEEVARRADDPHLIFRVQANTVETELFLGRRQEAARRLAEARRLLPQLHPRPELDAYLRAEAEAAWTDGDMDGAIGFLEQARRELEDGGETHGNAYAGLLSVLRLYDSLAGRRREAYRVAREMVDLHARHHRDDSVAGTVSRVVLAMSCYDIGEVERARDLFEEAVPEVKDPRTARTGAWLGLCWPYGDMLSRLGRPDDAIPLIRASLAKVREGGNRMYEIRARLVLARALLRAGRPEEAAAALDTVRTAAAGDGPGGVIWDVELERLEAEADLARQRPHLAQVEADRALALSGYPERAGGPRRGPALLTLARVQLALARPDEALASARAAAEVFGREAEDPARSADYGEAMLVVARADLASSDPEDAARSLRRAVPSLRQGLGADHVLTREAQDLQARVEKMGRGR